MWPWRKKEPEWQPTYQGDEVTFPDGTAVRIQGSDRIWYFTKGKRFHVPSERVLESWNFNSVGLTNHENTVPFKYGGKLGFRDGSLIRDISDNKLYLVSDNKRRHITDPDVFTKYGLNRGKIIEVSADEAQLHEDGEVLK